MKQKELIRYANGTKYRNRLNRNSNRVYLATFVHKFCFIKRICLQHKKGSKVQDITVEITLLVLSENLKFFSRTRDTLTINWH